VDTNFKSTKFGNKPNFQGTIFYDKADFTNAEIDGGTFALASLEGTNFNRAPSWSHVQFRKPEEV
jgi:hypothetical protein